MESNIRVVLLSLGEREREGNEMGIMSVML